MRIALGLILMIHVLAGQATGQEPPPPTQTADEAPRPRVVVYITRNRQVQGYLELETDEVIVVRDVNKPNEKPESFPKARIMQLVRLVEPQPGQQGQVFLRNGEVRDGVIIEDAFTHVTVEIEGIRARLKREDVHYVVLEPTIEQRYQEFKADLRPGMPEQHLMLCQWLFDAKRYQLCQQELDELLALSPNTTGAIRLKGVVEAQLKLANGRMADPAATSTKPQRAPRVDSRHPGQVLTHADVNLIRVFEIDFKRPPKVSIEPDGIRELIHRFGASPLIPATAAERTAMLRAEKLDIVRLMFELRARELYPQIDVLTEPYALNLFRQRVHDGWLMNNCATSQCHGGPHAGDLYLHRRGFKDERVRYTNLLILERLELEENLPLIDYENPESSLIVQYGMPRIEARHPHPDVKGWKPVFSKASRRMYDDTMTWINSMMQPRPDYPVRFDPRDALAPELEDPVWGDPDRAPR
jgi:hypothetical protein